MIRDWLTDNGKTKRYDTLSNLIAVLNQDGSVDEASRPATQDDLNEYYSVYPQYTQEEDSARLSMISTLQSGITDIDNFILIVAPTVTQINDVYNVIKSCVDSYQQYQYRHADVDQQLNVLISKSLLLQVKLARDLSEKNNLQANTIIFYESRLESQDLTLFKLKTRIDDYGIP